MHKAKIGIIGMGFVGCRLAEKFSQNCEIVTYDKNKDFEYPSEELSTCDFVMICVNTPPNPDGSVYINNVEDAIRDVPNDKILLRSTVPPGTTTYLAKKYSKNVCFSPEYVGESNFLSVNWNGFENSKPFFIIGGPTDSATYYINKMEIILGPSTKIMQMQAEEAELVKYMENSYFAMKVSFVNEFRQLAEKINLNWNSVREGWLLDPRVERDHTSAFKDAPGYSGKCLPKDVSGIIQFAKSKGFDMKVMQAIQDYNNSLY